MRNFGGNIHKAKTMRCDGVQGTKQLKFFNIPFIVMFRRIPSLDYILYGMIWKYIVAINSFNIGYFRVPINLAFKVKSRAKPFM